MVAEATQKPPHKHLRRRMPHILERAQSLSSLASSASGESKAPVVTKTEEVTEEIWVSSPTDYDTDSESSEDAGQDARVTADAERSPLPPANISRPEKDASRPSPVSTGAWYEFDLAVVVALVSPIGNWLTGGDHIKNLFLIILLIFYLHQIIEIPWALYHSARPRGRPPHLPPNETVEDRYRQLAASKLHTLEILFLCLCVLSPFVGALLLRTITSTVAGHDVVSWFSTSLFVLATGLRPWRHVVDRLSQHTVDLHDVIHYGPSDSNIEDMRQKIEDLLQRVARLEKSLAKVRNKVVDGTVEVYEYVDGVVDGVEKTVRKHERKFEKQEARVKVVEESVECLKTKGKGKAMYLDTTPSASSVLAYLLPEWLLSPPHRNLYSSPYSPSPRHSLRSSSSCIRLETIPEEGTKIATSPPLSSPVINLALRTTYLATLPLRAVLNLFFGRRY